MTMIVTVIMMSAMPVIVLTPRCSSRNIMPSATAVSGWSAPIMEVCVGPMRRTALTPVILETMVAQSPRPRM